VDQPAAGSLHHVELWVPDLGRAVQEWGWLLGRLGYESFQDWPDGRSWRLGDTYLVVEQSPALTAAEHDRLRPGLNHLAFHAGPRPRVDELAATVRRWIEGETFTPSRGRSGDARSNIGLLSGRAS
jgi:catechol 2,3-dioxygenase-like lactoylglutathione lyase family enzyme